MSMRVSPQHVQPGMRVESVVVPAGARAGSTIPVTLPDGSQFEVDVPDGFSAGQTFQFQVAEPPPVVAATVAQQQPNASVAVSAVPIAPVAAVPVVIAEQPVQGRTVPAFDPQLLPAGMVLPAGIKVGTGLGMVGFVMPADAGMVPPGAPGGGWMVRER